MKDIDWGSAPAWFGAIVTSLAFLIAAVAFFRQRADRRTDQARKVCCWPVDVTDLRTETERGVPVGHGGGQSVQVRVRNASELPVYEVSVWVRYSYAPDSGSMGSHERVVRCAARRHRCLGRLGEVPLQRPGWRPICRPQFSRLVRPTVATPTRRFVRPRPNQPRRSSSEPMEEPSAMTTHATGARAPRQCTLVSGLECTTTRGSWKRVGGTVEHHVEGEGVIRPCGARRPVRRCCTAYG